MHYNTDINIIGSIPDYHLIYKALPMLLNNQSELEDILVNNNEFDFRTEKYCIRIQKKFHCTHKNNQTTTK
jgi:hypothetical protein